MFIRTAGENSNQCGLSKLQDKQRQAPKEVSEALPPKRVSSNGYCVTTSG